MSAPRLLPAWAEDLRRRYLRGEAAIFVLHGNVYDAVIDNGALLSLSEFLVSVLLKDSRTTIAVYNVSSGTRLPKRSETIANWVELTLETEKDKVLAALEKLLTGTTKTAVLLEYAEVIAPAGDTNFQSETDRAAIVTLHRWSFLPEIERGDNLVLLITENLSELAPKLVANPKVAVIEIQLQPTFVSLNCAPRVPFCLTEIINTLFKSYNIMSGAWLTAIQTLLAPRVSPADFIYVQPALFTVAIASGKKLPALRDAPLVRKLAQIDANLRPPAICPMLCLNRRKDSAADPEFGGQSREARRDGLDDIVKNFVRHSLVEFPFVAKGPDVEFQAL